MEVKAKISIADHYRTFALADDGEDDPARELIEAINKYDLPQEQFVMLKEGVPMIF